MDDGCGNGNNSRDQIRSDHTHTYLSTNLPTYTPTCPPVHLPAYEPILLAYLPVSNMTTPIMLVNANGNIHVNGSKDCDGMRCSN